MLPLRVGILPYTIMNNQIYVLIGIDRKSGDLTDFGGGRKQNESFVNGALRECREETEGVIAYYPNDIKCCLASSTRRTGVIFLPIKTTATVMAGICHEIKKRLTERSEMSDVEWIPWTYLLKLVLHPDKSTRKIYERIRATLVRDVNHKPNFFLQSLYNHFGCSSLAPPQINTEGDFPKDIKKACQTQSANLIYPQQPSRVALEM